jgi:hypothetical protein
MQSARMHACAWVVTTNWNTASSVATLGMGTPSFTSASNGSEAICNGSNMKLSNEQKQPHILPLRPKFRPHSPSISMTLQMPTSVNAKRLTKNQTYILQTNWLCGAEHHSRGHKLCSHSVVSQHFMEPEGSLPCSQELSTCTYPLPDQSSPQHSILTYYKLCGL